LKIQPVVARPDKPLVGHYTFVVVVVAVVAVLALKFAVVLFGLVRGAVLATRPMAAEVQLRAVVAAVELVLWQHFLEFYL